MVKPNPRIVASLIKPHLIIGVQLPQEVQYSSGDDGVDTDEEVDAHVADEGHLCVFKHGCQEIHPGERGKSVQEITGSYRDS